MEEQIIHPKKELHTIKNRKTSTIDTKYDKNNNKISMPENPNEVDKQKVTKDNNISLSMDSIDSLTSGILETVDKQLFLLMIEAEEPPP